MKFMYMFDIIGLICQLFYCKTYFYIKNRDTLLLLTTNVKTLFVFDNTPIIPYCYEYKHRYSKKKSCDHTGRIKQCLLRDRNRRLNH